MSQVESMRGAKILTPRRRGIETCSRQLLRRSAPAVECSGNRCPEIDGYQAMAKPGTQTAPDIDVEEKLKEAFARGWSVIVWNDPVNLMDYVVYVFKTVLKMNEKDASKHMWEVHQNGKSMVARETREKSELIVHRLRGFGLNATLEQE
jgi:ATP-dependent Clp protease adaptor protein ClpS